MKGDKMKKSTIFSIGLILVAVLLLGLTGCRSSKTVSSTVASSTSGNSVSIANFTFTPGTLTVPAGTTVTWTNNDSATHRVASDTGVFNSGDLPQNASFTFTFNNTGTFPYHCSIHTYMHGTIIVK
jgi:plastocyanin